VVARQKLRTSFAADVDSGVQRIERLTDRGWRDDCVERPTPDSADRSGVLRRRQVGHPVIDSVYALADGGVVTDSRRARSQVRLVEWLRSQGANKSAKAVT